MIYLDNAATTFPKPRNVVESVKSAVEFYGGNPGRGGHSFAMRVSEKIYGVRKKVATMFCDGISPTRVVFTASCTMSLNIAIKGIAKKGDHIITSCLEHNSSIRPVRKLAADGVITYDIAKVMLTEEQTVERFRSLINANTKAIVCTHASNVTGEIMPISKIGKLCREYNLIFIVDAAQTAGILPINMTEMNIDILCTAGHKALYGITGTGVMIMREGIELDTIIEGGTGSFSSLPYQPTDYPDRLESGTLNTAGILSIGAGIDYINSVGMANLLAIERAHCKKVIESLTPFVEVKSKIISTPVVAFVFRNMPSEVAVAQLNEQGFALRGGLHCAPLAHEHYNTLDSGMVRFSPSGFTTDQSVDKFIKTVKSLLKKV